MDDHKAHGLTYRLGRSLRRHQREVRRSAQILRRLRSEDSALRRLQEFGLEHLRHCHGVQRWCRLAIRGIRFISEMGGGSARLRRKADVRA